jgi:hypothetical protein
LDITFEYFEAKFLPFLIGSALFIVAVVGLINEIVNKNDHEKQSTKTEVAAKTKIGAEWGVSVRRGVVSGVSPGYLF